MGVNNWILLPHLSDQDESISAHRCPRPAGRRRPLHRDFDQWAQRLGHPGDADDLRPPDLPPGPHHLTLSDPWTVNTRPLNSCVPVFFYRKQVTSRSLWSNCLVFLSDTCVHWLIGVETESMGWEGMWSRVDRIYYSLLWLAVEEILPAVGLSFPPFFFLLPSLFLCFCPTNKTPMPNMLLDTFFLSLFHTLFECRKLHKYRNITNLIREGFIHKTLLS